MKPLALHHVTAVTGDAQSNLDFYTGTLGMRLVKLTVNFDDPSSYHLYYGDAEGRPGTLMTFFDFAGARRGHPGNGQVNAVAFATASDALDSWRERLRGAGTPWEEATRFGTPMLRFADPDGLTLEISGSLPAGSGAGLRHIEGVTLGRPDTGFLARLGWTSQGSEEGRQRWGPATQLDSVDEGERARPGSGTVHHVAWRAADDAELLEWRRRLLDNGVHVSPVMDRTYFHSIYFREPGGTLFEIATDPPGFTVDQPLSELGTRLVLPPQFEPHRARIEANLTRLTLPALGAAL